MIDVFKIGVSIAMTSNANQMLGIMLARLVGVHGAIGNVNNRLGSMKVLAVGALTAVAGVKALEGLWAIVRAGSALNRELERTKQLGGDFAKNIDQERMTAFRTANDVPTIAPSQAVRLQRELGSVIGNDIDAGTALPYAARMAHVVGNFTGENEEDIIKNLVKFADIRAKIFSEAHDGKEHVDFKKLLPEMEAAAKALLIGGNYLKSGDLLQLAKQAGVPIKGVATGDAIAALAEMAISQGGARTGTALTSLSQQMLGGTMTKPTAIAMTEAGLLKPGDWVSDHGKVILNSSGLNRNKAIEADPIKWITGEGKAAVEKYAAKEKISTMAAVYRIFGRQTTQRLVAEALQAGPQFERAREFFHQIPGMDEQFKKLQEKNLETNIVSFHAAWKGLMEALGEQGVPLAIGVIHKMVDAMHAMTMWAAANPDASRHMMEFAAGIAAIAAVSGTLAVIGAGMKIIGGGLITVGEAVATVVGVFSKLGPLGAFLLGMKPTEANSGEKSELDRMFPAGPDGKRTFNPLATPPQVMTPPRAPTVKGPPGEGENAAENEFSPRINLRRATDAASAPRPSAPINLQGDVNLDGQKVGEIVGRQVMVNQIQQLRRAQGGSAGFDMRVMQTGAASP